MRLSEMRQSSQRDSPEATLLLVCSDPLEMTTGRPFGSLGLEMSTVGAIELTIALIFFMTFAGSSNTAVETGFGEEGMYRPGAVEGREGGGRRNGKRKRKKGKGRGEEEGGRKGEN